MSLPSLSSGRMIELAAAVLIFAAGVYFYRRRDKSDSYGSQGAVILFVVAAVALLAAGIWLYRRPKGTDGYGSQGAVLLFVVAAIMGVHALGGLDYHPSQGELDAMQERGR